MKSTKSVLLFLIAIAIIFGLTIGKAFFIKILMPPVFFPLVKDEYPEVWNSIKIGDKRSAIFQKMGQTPYDIWELKGDVWTKETLFGWNQCRVFYNTDTVVDSYYIEAFLGNKEIFTSKLIKSEVLKTQN